MPTQDKAVGGQALIEGVMMRGPDSIVIACRKPSKEIIVEKTPFVSLTKRQKILGIPVIRGAVSFFEMLVIGIKTLNYSANIAMQGMIEIEKSNETEKPVDHDIHDDSSSKVSEKSEATSGIALAVGGVLAFVFGIAIFFLLPIFVASLFGLKRNALTFNLAAGGIRIVLFLCYLWLISLWKEIRRVFEYHGAEHKSIFTYEAGEELTIENARKHMRLHPRCGTSFLLIVACIAVLTFSVTDSFFTIIFGHAPNVLQRFVTHMGFLPLVAGVSFELLKLSGKTRNNTITKVLILPGLWLQKITTLEPDDEQLEVALITLRHALNLEPQPDVVKEVAAVV